MIMQAGEYERAQGKDLSQFFDSTAGRFTTPRWPSVGGGDPRPTS